MQKRYTDKFLVATPGQHEGYGEPGVATRVNSALDVMFSVTITVPATVDANATYEVAATGTPFQGSLSASFVTSGSPTQSALTAGLLSAIRSSDLFQHFYATAAANVITLKARAVGASFTVTAPSNATTTNDLTIGTPVAPSASANIPFGVFVVRKTGVDANNEVRLPDTNTGVAVQGVSFLTHATRKQGIGQEAITAYRPNEALDVYQRDNSCHGIWVRTADSSLGIDDTVYIDCVTTGQQGWLTKTSTNNLALPASCKVVEGAKETLEPGVFIARVAMQLLA